MQKIHSKNNFIFFTATLVCVLLASAVVSSTPAGENYRLIQAVLMLIQVVAYFSFITMTSTGYGDIIPVLPVTRTLAYMQAITGTFYMAVVVANLVGAYSRAAK